MPIRVRVKPSATPCSTPHPRKNRVMATNNSGDQRNRTRSSTASPPHTLSMPPRRLGTQQRWSATGWSGRSRRTEAPPRRTANHRLESSCPFPFRAFLRRTSRSSNSVDAWFGLSLLLPQHQVHNPTAANVRSVGSVVVQDLLVFAPGILEGVGQERNRGEVAALVAALGN